MEELLAILSQGHVLSVLVAALGGIGYLLHKHQLRFLKTEAEMRRLEDKINSVDGEHGGTLDKLDKMNDQIQGISRKLSAVAAKVGAEATE